MQIPVEIVVRSHNPLNWSQLPLQAADHLKPHVYRPLLMSQIQLPVQLPIKDALGKAETGDDEGTQDPCRDFGDGAVEAELVFEGYVDVVY